MIGPMRVVMAIVMALALAACTGKAPSLPPDAPGVVKPEEYSFGDAVSSRDHQATLRVLDLLEARFGDKSMDITIRNLPDDADPKAIEAYYQGALAGWTEMELGDDAFDQSWSFALVSPDGRHALAVVALRPDSVVNSGQVPLNILTNLTIDKP